MSGFLIQRGKTDFCDNLFTGHNVKGTRVETLNVSVETSQLGQNRLQVSLIFFSF